MCNLLVFDSSVHPGNDVPLDSPITFTQLSALFSLSVRLFYEKIIVLVILYHSVVRQTFIDVHHTCDNMINVSEHYKEEKNASNTLRSLFYIEREMQTKNSFNVISIISKQI